MHVNGKADKLWARDKFLNIEDDQESHESLHEAIGVLQAHITEGNVSAIRRSLVRIFHSASDSQLSRIESAFECDSMASAFVYCVFVRDNDIRRVALATVAKLCCNTRIAQCFIDIGFITIITQSLEQGLDLSLCSYLLIVLESLMNARTLPVIPLDKLQLISTKDADSSYFFAKLLLDAVLIDSSYQHHFVYDSIAWFWSLDLSEGFHFLCWCLAYVSCSASFSLTDFLERNMHEFLLACLENCRHVKRAVCETCASLCNHKYRLEIPLDTLWQFATCFSRPDLAASALLALRSIMHLDARALEFFSDSSKWAILLADCPYTVSLQTAFLLSDYICLVNSVPILQSLIESGAMNFVASLASGSDDPELLSAIARSISHMIDRFSLEGRCDECISQIQPYFPEGLDTLLSGTFSIGHNSHVESAGDS